MNAKPLNVLILIASCVVLFNARCLDIVQREQTIVIKMIKKNAGWYEARDQRPPNVVGTSIVRAPFGVIAPSAITHSVVTLLTVSIFQIYII